MDTDQNKTTRLPDYGLRDFGQWSCGLYLCLSVDICG